MSQQMKPESKSEKIEMKWAELLQETLSKPGTISTAYSQFWRYSFGNQLLAIWQCQSRGIPVGPINTYKGWEKLGRHVKKGQRAISLCMPVVAKEKRTGANQETKETGTTTEGRDVKDVVTRRFFIYRRNWFVLPQTDGEEYKPEPLPNFHPQLALKELDIALIPFEHTDGNCQGYAVGQQIAINPVASHPIRTMFHEIGHVVLGHTAELMADNGEQTPKDIKELEAEAVSYLVCSALNLGTEQDRRESRGYIQNWYEGNAVPEKSAIRIFGVVDKILKAGTGVKAESGAERNEVNEVAVC